MIVSLSLPLPLEPSHVHAGDDPTLRLSVSARMLRLRRQLPSSSGPNWLVDLELELAVPDPEEVLAGSEGFLVDAADGRDAGVVEDVELGPEGAVSALIVSGGWLGRRRVRMEAKAIEAIVPEERRIVVRA